MLPAMRRLLALTLLVACEESTPPPQSPPSFEGNETRSWLAYEIELPGRTPSELFPAFEASARALGCRIEKLGYGTTQNIYGERRTWYGVSATCEEGTIALVTMVDERVRIGCAKPTTRTQCDALLQKISEAR